ncbi:MAG TPA: hypothetical protein VFI65_24655, partial [Streptosporangiaceae bacterium]|nr:hypothetical protein [Streptosporangiaceae bacterium]
LPGRSLARRPRPGQPAIPGQPAVPGQVDLDASHDLFAAVTAPITLPGLRLRPLSDRPLPPEHAEPNARAARGQRGERGERGQRGEAGDRPARPRSSSDQQAGRPARTADLNLVTERVVTRLRHQQRLDRERKGLL